MEANDFDRVFGRPSVEIRPGRRHRNGGAAACTDRRGSRAWRGAFGSVVRRTSALANAIPSLAAAGANGAIGGSANRIKWCDAWWDCHLQAEKNAEEPSHPSKL